MNIPFESGAKVPYPYRASDYYPLLNEATMLGSRKYHNCAKLLSWIQGEQSRHYTCELVWDLHIYRWSPIHLYYPYMGEYIKRLVGVKDQTVKR